MSQLSSINFLRALVGFFILISCSQFFFPFSQAYSQTQPDTQSSPEPQPGLHRAVIIARDRASLSSEMAGKIINMPFNVGDAFKKNDVLVSFDCHLLELNLAKASKDEEGAKRKWESISQLAKMESTGRLNADLAFVEFKKAEVERKTASTLVERCSLRAPYDGHVIRHMVQNFENVNVGQPLIEIVGSKILEIESAIPGMVAGGLKVGQKFIFKSDQGEIIVNGHVIGIAPVIDPVSQLVSIRGAIDGGGPLIIGVTGSLQFEGGT